MSIDYQTKWLYVRWSSAKRGRRGRDKIVVFVVEKVICSLGWFYNGAIPRIFKSTNRALTGFV